MARLFPHDALYGIRLFETAPGMRLAVLPDPPTFSIAAVSKDLCRLFGLSKAKLVGRGYIEACREYTSSTPVPADALLASLNYVLTHKSEHRVVDPDFGFRTEDRPFRTNTWTTMSTPLLNSAGEVEFIIITSEEHDPIAESRLRQTFAIDTVGVMYFDLGGGIHDANPAFARMSGYSRKDFAEGKVTWDKLSPPEFKELTAKSMRELIDKWENTPYEKQYRRPDGSRWWGLVAAKRLTQNECVAFIIDITVIKQVEQELERRVAVRTHELACLNEELQRSNKSLEEFAYAVSHDLKEPIRKIRVFCDRLMESLSEGITSEDKMLFERIFNATNRMNLLIDDLLLYSHVDINEAHIDDVNLNELIQPVLDDLETEIEAKRAVVEVSSLFTMKGRKRQLQQIFYNLIGNSLKYSKPDVPPHITITCKPVAVEEIIDHTVPLDKKYFQITVKDNGIGFDPIYADHIFGVFTRLHSPKEYNGTGIGLSIVRKVVENHKGFISAEGRPGEGASFKILFPTS